jgi:hypothetical protein
MVPITAGLHLLCCLLHIALFWSATACIQEKDKQHKLSAILAMVSHLTVGGVDITFCTEVAIDRMETRAYTGTWAANEATPHVTRCSTEPS